MQSNCQKVNLSNCVQLACVWTGTVIGGGFAMGRQTVRFYTSYGWTALFLPLLSIIVLSACYYNAWNFARLTKSYEYRKYVNTFYAPYDKVFANIADFLFIFSLAVPVGASLAGGATVLQDLFGIPYILGCTLFTALVTLIALFGASVVRKCSFGLSVVIFLTLGTIAVMAFAQKGIQIAEVIKNHTIVNGATYGAAIWSAILYTANSSNYAPMIAVADKIKTKKEVLVTTIIGGVVLTLALTMVCTMCLGWLPDIIEVAIPHLKITQDIGVSWLYAFYIVALLAAYITTSTTFIFAAGKRFENIFFFRNLKSDSFFMKKPNRKFTVVAVAVAVYAMLVSLLGVMTIINKGMAICGLLYLPVILIPQVFIAPFKCRKLEKEQAAKFSRQNPKM